MFGLDGLETLFVGWGFIFQIVLIIHFTLRKWAFARYAWRYGWAVYALAIPALLVSLVLIFGGKPWSLWIAGLIYLVWAVYGYRVDYVQRIRWRNPLRWRIAGPYVTLYLATIMFYWWPLGLVSRPLWVVYALLFVISTWLNITSHHPSLDLDQATTMDTSQSSGGKP